ncbi:MAG: type II secretion system protein GspC [Thiohalorhabdus sp.]|uniref:type II secretion system protein GspC n=1 Tax=Thiohalorhabdus sp. TaxID=3094134 RepID=UPI00397F0D45
MAYIPALNMPRLLSRFSPTTGIRLAEGVLVVVLAVALADLTWDLFPSSPPSAGLSQDSKSPSVPGGPEGPGADSPGRQTEEGPVSEGMRQLFGSPASEENDPEDEAPVRETRLDLTLKGIIASQEGEQKVALIASGEEGEEGVYRVGDTLAGGAEILRIEPRRVILRRNGVTEALNLEVAELEGSISQQDSPDGESGIQKEGANSRVVPERTVRENLENLPSLLRQAKAVPHKVNGEPAGFRIENIQSGSIYEDLGLREGDVVKSVNGQDIRTSSDALGAYREMKGADKYEVRLERDGQEQTLNYSVR